MFRYAVVNLRKKLCVTAATPDAIVLASNSALSGRDKFFMRDDALLCAHAGLFDKTSVLVMRSSKAPAGSSMPVRWRSFHR